MLVHRPRQIDVVQMRSTRWFEISRHFNTRDASKMVCGLQLFVSRFHSIRWTCDSSIIHHQEVTHIQHMSRIVEFLHIDLTATQV